MTRTSAVAWHSAFCLRPALALALLTVSLTTLASSHLEVGPGTPATTNLIVSPASLTEGEIVSVTAMRSHVESGDFNLTVSSGDPIEPPQDPVLRFFGSSLTSSPPLSIRTIAFPGYDGDYTITLMAQTSDSSRGSNPPSLTFTVRDAQSPPTVSLSLSPPSISEDGGASTVTASMDGPARSPVMVTVSATSNAVMLSQNRVLTIAAGQTTSTGTVTVTAVDDDEETPDRMVTVSGTASIDRSTGLSPRHFAMPAPSDVTLTITNDDFALPAQVTGVTVMPEIGQLTVNWDPATNADGYKVQWKSGSQNYDPATRQHTISDGTVTAYTIPNLTAGTEHTVRVIATRAETADGQPSAEVTGTPAPTPPPAQVTGVTVTQDSRRGRHGQLIVSWDRVADADGYRVQWISGSESFASPNEHIITSGNTLAYTIADLTRGIEYTMRVIATRTDAVDGTPSMETTGIPWGVPDRVTGVTLARVDAGTARVTWDRVLHTQPNVPVSYAVQWRRGTGGTFNTVQAGTNISLDLTELQTGRQYQVRVVAAATIPGLEETIFRVFSDIVTYYNLGTPGGVTVTPGAHSLVVNWDGVTFARSYKVQWKSGSQNYDETTRQAIVSSGTGHTIPNLIMGTEYTVRVITIRDDTPDGDPSNEVTGTPKTDPPGQVTGVTVTSGIEQLSVSWDRVTDADGYKVQWKSGSQSYDGTSRQNTINDGAATTSTISGLNSGTAYTVRVIATRNNADDGQASDEATVTPTARMVTLMLSHSIINESGAANVSTVTASLDRAISSTAVTVSVAAEGGGVTLSANRVLTIAAGQTTSTGTVTITAVDNNIDAPNRAVTVSGGVTGGDLADPASRILTITDDEATPTVTLTLMSPSINENGGTTRVMATMNHASSQPTTVTVTANAGLYTVGSPATLTIPASQTSSAGPGVVITAVNDDIDNALDRSGDVTGTAANSYGVVATAIPATLTLTDDDNPPTVTLALVNSSINENGGTTRVRATQSRLSSQPTMVTVMENTGLYTVGSPATLTIPAGSTSSTGSGVLITAVDDRIDNIPNRSGNVTATASNSEGVVATATPVTLTLRDDEESPTVTLVLEHTAIPEDGGSTAVTATLSPASSQDIMLTVSAAAVPPTEVNDFTLVGSTLTIAAGETTSTGDVTIIAVNNDAANPDRAVTVSSTMVTGGGRIQNLKSQILTITNNDNAGIGLSKTAVTVAENAGTDTYTVALTSQPTGDVTVTPTSSTSAAAIVEPQTLTFTSGNWNTVQTVTVTGVDDDRVGDRIVTIDHTSAGGGYDSIAAAVELTVSDDESPPAGGRVALPTGFGYAYTLEAAQIPSTVPDDERIPDGILAFDISVFESDGDEISTISEEAQVCLIIDDDARTALDRKINAGTTASRLSLFHLPDGSGTWNEVRNSGPNADDTEVCGDTRTFSLFAIGITTKRIQSRDIAMVLAGVARTIASDAMEMVTSRFNKAPSAANSNGHMTLGGKTLTMNAELNLDSQPFHTMEIDWPSDLDQQDSTHTGADLSAEALLSRSAFELPLKDTDGRGTSAWTLWGRGSASGFDGSPGDNFDMDGTLYSGYIGVDYRPQPTTLFGLAISHTTGDVDYERTGANAGGADIDIDLTRILPYAHWQANDGLDLWVLAGIGDGEMKFKPESDDERITTVTTDLSSYLGAIGATQALTTWQGIDLRAKADAFMTSLRSSGDDDIPELRARGRANRVRLQLEGQSQWEVDADTHISPRLAIGGRWDSGTAEEGAGVEVSGGLSYTQTAVGLKIDAQGRYLISHNESDFEDWGASLDIQMGSGTSGTGAYLSIAPVWGQASSEVEQLWSDENVLDTISSDSSPGWRPQQLDIDLGYRMDLGDRSITPYGGLSLDGDNSRYTFGSRWEIPVPNSTLNISIEGSRQRRADEDDETNVAVRFEWKW